MFKFSFLLAFLFSFELHAAPRTVFVQLFEWPWKDIARECEIYLGPSGFSAVQVSPPHEHIIWQNNPWWERYQVVSYKIHSRSGTEDEFADMVKRCHQAGVDIYVDAVLNHMTGIPGGTGIGGTNFSHYDYPGTYSWNDFHHCGRNGNDDIKNYTDLYELQSCELLDLADLSTESEYVRNKMAEYLNHLLDLGVAGFRLDAAKHIAARDLKAITEKLNRSAYIYQEIIYNPGGPVEYSDYLPVGDVMAYDYPHAISRGFKSKSTDTLQYIANGFPRSEDSVVFITNHDLERTDANSVLSYNADRKLYRLAQAFMLAWPFGYPQLFSGYKFSNYDDGPPLIENFMSHPVMDAVGNCQAPFTCEHRAPEIANLVYFRNVTNDAFYVSNYWSNGYDQLSFSRGSLGFMALNYSDYALTRSFATSMPEGSYCNIVDVDFRVQKNSCAKTYYVDRNGYVSATLNPQSALVLVSTMKLNRTLDK
jgi:alpha-amylase